MSFDLKIVNGDLSITKGSLDTVINTEKLAQEVLKILITPTGALPNYPWYGTLLSRTLVGSILAEDVMLQAAKVQVQNALTNLKTLHEELAKKYQVITADEQLHSILDISIYRSNSDYRLYYVKVRVLSKGFKPLDTTFTVSTI